MTKSEAIELRTKLEQFLTDEIDRFQIESGLVVDDVELTFEGVRVTLLQEDGQYVEA